MKIRHLFFLLIFIGSTNKVLSQENKLPFGINLCGPEFGSNNLPGKYGIDYIYPYEFEVDYFLSKGFKLISIPFRWERLQPELYKDLNESELRRISRLIDLCARKGVSVKLVMQNFGRYSKDNKEYVIGTDSLSDKALMDVWFKISSSLVSKTNIYGYNIMNEPHDMSTTNTWNIIAQKTIDTIRNVNCEHAIFVCGDNYGNSDKWPEYNDSLKYLIDPADKLFFESHCYFDNNSSGNYNSILDYNILSNLDVDLGVNKIRPFVNWLKKNNKKGFIGEYGVPNDDTRWLDILDKFLSYLTENGINCTYWSAGPWWHDYKLSVEPKFGIDKPQMKILEKYNYARN